MASGDALLQWEAPAGFPPATNYATQDTRNAIPTLDFDAATREEIFFAGFMPGHYGGGGVNVVLAWMASTATTGDCRWETAFERHQDDVDDLDADGFATGNASNATTASGSGEVKYTTIAHTNGAQMDSVAAGEHFRLRVARDAANAGDTMAGDSELVGVFLSEV